MRVIVCDIETSTFRQPRPESGCGCRTVLYIFSFKNLQNKINTSCGCVVADKVVSISGNNISCYYVFLPETSEYSDLIITLTG
jgi:hypothetical protein